MSIRRIGKVSRFQFLSPFGWCFHGNDTVAIFQRKKVNKKPQIKKPTKLETDLNQPLNHAANLATATSSLLQVSVPHFPTRHSPVMSQDNYYKRHRSDNNAPLSQLDLNQVQNVSHIPQLSSSMKRTSGRASARQSMIGAPRTNSTVVNNTHKRSSVGLSEMVQQSSMRSSNRKSLAGLNSVSRPNPRSSSLGIGAFGNINNNFGLLSQPKDPRPLRDKNHQQQLQNEIFEFLTVQNFENEMKHPLTQKSLKNPTQKDFVLIFQFLYKKVDPGYRFTKSIEHEVYYVLKNLKYPYLETINKSQISAVGGQSWPVFLGVLHWLIQLVGKIEGVTNIYSSRVPPEDLAQLQPEANELELEKILVNYIVKSYNAFLNNIDDYSNFYAEMEQDYAEYSHDIVSQTKKLEEENLKLKEVLDKLLTEAKSLNVVEQKSQALDSDVFKFQAYIETMLTRKKKWGPVLEHIKQEMINSENELKEIENEKTNIQKQMTEQGLTPTDIDRMNNERDRVSKAIDGVNQKLNEISKVVHSKEIEAQHVYDELSDVLKEYNYSLHSIASTSVDINVSEFVIRLDNLLSEDRIGLRQEELLEGQDLKGIRTSLQKAKNMITLKIHQLQDEGMNIQEKIDSANEALNEKSEQIESLEAKLSAMKLDYEELYETMTKEATSYHTEIERFEMDIKSLQSTSKQSISLLEQESRLIDAEYETLVNQIRQERKILRAKAETLMNAIITFKLNVQGSLEDLENMVVDELEKQRNEQAVA